MESVARAYWKYSIYAFCGALFVVPYSDTFIVNDTDEAGQWSANFLFQYVEHSVLLVLITVLLIGIPKIKNRKSKRLLILTLCLLSSINLLLAMSVVRFPVQDFIPRVGVLFLIILFPIVLIDAVIEWRKS